MQAPPDFPRTSAVRLGPLRVNPSITLRDIGTDSNVFNEPTNPKQDLTAALSPEAEAWLGMGRSRLQAKARVDLLYFERYASERSVSTDTQVAFDLRLGRLTPYVTKTFRSSRQRVNLEIDARARRVENAAAAGTSVRLTKKTTAAMEVHHSRFEFDPSAVFRGTNLREVLDRTDDGLSAAVRHRLTPFTTFVIAADTQSTRFPFSPLRAADSVHLGAGVEFNARALLNGSAYVGRQKFNVLDANAPDFQGTVASVDVAHTLGGTTRLALRVDRNVEYSFEANERIT